MKGKNRVTNRNIVGKSVPIAQLYPEFAQLCTFFAIAINGTII